MLIPNQPCSVVYISELSSHLTYTDFALPQESDAGVCSPLKSLAGRRMCTDDVKVNMGLIFWCCSNNQVGSPMNVYR
jgi:hypothetical protein